MTNPAPPDPASEDEREIARLKRQRQLEAEQSGLAKDRLKSQTELETARAGLVAAYGLPSFEGKTTLDAGAGAIEAAILATEAVDAAARQIVADVQGPLPDAPASRRFLILAGDEPLDFGRAAALKAEISHFERIFDSVQPRQAASRSEAFAAIAGLAAPVAALKAVAGLLRTETKVTAVDHTAAFSHRVLATAVAGQLGSSAYFPSAASDGAGDDSQLIQRLGVLTSRRDAVEVAAQALQPPASDAIKASIARFDAFLIRVTSPDADGRFPLVEAARLEALSDDDPLVLRVYVEKAGGSLIHRTNLWTFFGRDPVKVSGGLVVSYALTDPRTGRVLSARVLSGRTQLSSLRKIQSGGFFARKHEGTRDFRTNPKIFVSRLAVADGRALDQGRSALLDRRRASFASSSSHPRSFFLASDGTQLECTVTVTPKDGTAAGWMIQYQKWLGEGVPAAPKRTITDWNSADGKYSANITLDRHEYRIIAQVSGGSDIEVDISPRYRVVYPGGNSWPLKVSLGTETQKTGLYYFMAGEVA